MLVFDFQAAQLRDAKNRQDLDLARKTQQVNNLNGIVTQLKQEMATKDGEMGRLRTQIGELNSQNIRHTVATHAAPPYIPPQPAIAGKVSTGTSRWVSCIYHNW